MESGEVGNWEAGSSLAVSDGLLYLYLRDKKNGNTGMCTIDMPLAQLLKSGPASQYFAIGNQHYVVGGGPRQTRFRKMIVADKSTLKAIGEGFLVNHRQPVKLRTPSPFLAGLKYGPATRKSVWGNRSTHQ